MTNEKKYMGIKQTTKMKNSGNTRVFTSDIEDALDLIEFEIGKGEQAKEIEKKLRDGEKVTIEKEFSFETFELTEEAPESTLDYAERVLGELEKNTEVFKD